MAPWCEHCRDHVASDHYDAEGRHGIGDEYGWHGRLLAEAAQARELRADVARLRAGLERIAAAPHHPADPPPWYVTVARDTLDAS